jgi:hypothetical protein
VEQRQVTEAIAESFTVDLVLEKQVIDTNSCATCSFDLNGKAYGHRLHCELTQGNDV